MEHYWNYSHTDNRYYLFFISRLNVAALTKWNLNERKQDLMYGNPYYILRARK